MQYANTAAWVLSPTKKRPHEPGSSYFCLCSWHWPVPLDLDDDLSTVLDSAELQLGLLCYDRILEWRTPG
jgi:hypothetical protein